MSEQPKAGGDTFVLALIIAAVSLLIAHVIVTHVRWVP